MSRDLMFYLPLAFASTPGMSTGLAAVANPTRHYIFSLDTVEILNTRSRYEDTDYASFSLAINDGPKQTASRFLGDLNNGIHGVGLSFDVPMGVNDSVALTYAIVNSGHQNPDEARKALAAATDTLAKKTAEKVAQAGGAALGALLGAEIGTAAIPIIGTAVGALAGWLVNSFGNLLFANCDGAVAAVVTPILPVDVWDRTQGGNVFRQTDDHPGTNSPHGCGSNSHYKVSWSVAAR